MGKVVLIVDEGIQGFRKEFETLSELLGEFPPLSDVEEVVVTVRKKPAIGKPVSQSKD